MRPTEPTRLATVDAVRAWTARARAEGQRVGFVPTMGALHEGHLSLVRLARQRCERVVVSVFVNPTQFGPDEDFDAYPRDLAADSARLATVGADAVFSPSVEEVYPSGDLTRVSVDRITEGLCGTHRPGHFEGVTTVVSRLFNIVRPDVAVFGEKDYQQLAAIRRMTRDLHFDIEIVGGPIVREADGLAMSSRNAYLSPAERQSALVLSRALREAAEAVRAGVNEPAKLLARVREHIASEPLAELDYAELRDAETLEPIDQLTRPAVLAVAAAFGRARLLDNIVLETP